MLRFLSFGEGERRSHVLLSYVYDNEVTEERSPIQDPHPNSKSKDHP